MTQKTEVSLQRSGIEYSSFKCIPLTGVLTMKIFQTLAIILMKSDA